MLSIRNILVLLTLTLTVLHGQILDKVQPGETELQTPVKYLDGIVNPKDSILNTVLPKEVKFNDSTGKVVTLGEIIANGKPSLVCMMYMGCRSTCGPLMNDVYTKINNLNIKPGKDFNLVFISMDASENSELAAAKKDSFIEAFSYKDGEGQYYLTGSRESVAQVTKALDFNFRAIQETGDFSHPTVVYFTTPDAKVSRFLTGFDFVPQDLRLSLLNAGEGKIGTVVDNILVRCYKFDSQNKKYIYNSMMLMSISGAVTLFSLSLFLGFLWYSEFKNKKNKIVNQK